MIEETIQINQSESVKLSATDLNQPLEVSDAELVKAVLAGDESAFELIFERYRRLLAHLVGRFFRQRQEIEDLVQQSFTKIYFSLKDFRGGHEKSFPSWITRLTVNVCYDELRRRQRRLENSFADFGNDERDYLEQLFEDKSPTTETKLVAKDLADKVLSGLDVKDRLAMTLHYGEDFSIAEVANIVGWSESNVKTRLFRCRKNLRSLFTNFFS